MESRETTHVATGERPGNDRIVAVHSRTQMSWQDGRQHSLSDRKFEQESWQIGSTVTTVGEKAGEEQ